MSACNNFGQVNRTQGQKLPCSFDSIRQKPITHRSSIEIFHDWLAYRTLINEEIPLQNERIVQAVLRKFSTMSHEHILFCMRPRDNSGDVKNED